MLKDILNLSLFYNIFGILITGKKAKGYSGYLREYVKPFPGCKVLDIGCGTATILEFLGKEVEYFGFDFNSDYINHAKSKFADYPNASFICADVGEYLVNNESFDIIMMNGVMHHLTDEQVEGILSKVSGKLSVGGHFCSFDGVYLDRQRSISLMMLKNDRGQFVRTQAEYDKLVLKYFPQAKVKLIDDWLRVPYDHIVYY